MTVTTSLACRCGQVRLEVEGAPMVAAECHCTSCRTAAGVFETLPGAVPVRTPEGGSQYELYRKDRVRFLAGTEWLREHRLTPSSGTRRVVASCCNTPLFTEFQSGHWLSLYAGLWPEPIRPPMQLRTMVSDLPAGIGLDDSLPNAKTQTLGFYWALLSAWVAMGFAVPKLDFVKGRLEI